MEQGGLRAFGMDRSALLDFFHGCYGKGAYHAEAFFRHLYARGNADVGDVAEFLPAPALALRVSRDLKVILPELSLVQDDGGTRKIAPLLSDGSRVESVLIPMATWHTLCVSSQVGCARGCGFCETARMGLKRNLKTEEIVAQWALARFRLGVAPRNVVFMGMGEPFDNFDSVVQAVRILSDPRGADIPKRRISISTSGHVEGIRRLGELEQRFPEEAWRTVHLAVSLNSVSNAVRSSLMPINRRWPLEELKAALRDLPQASSKDALYFEYVVIPGVNSSAEDARALAGWMEGLEAKVNIIPYHPRKDSPWEAPDEAVMERFFRIIRSAGIECRTRSSRGEKIQAACGMLGGTGPAGGRPAVAGGDSAGG